MKPSWPRYLLFTETWRRGPGSPGWRFLLHSLEADHSISASDQEPGMRGERLALMAVVRGLEALDQPSAVRLVTGSTFIRRGVSRGLAEWRDRGWKWERFGRLVPVRHEDLWRRIDRALKFHRVSTHGWRPMETGPETREKNRARVPATAAEKVLDGALNEPALLIVRGTRRHVCSPQPSLSANGLAAAC